MAASVGSSTLNGDSSVRFSRALITCDTATNYVCLEEVLGMSKW